MSASINPDSVTPAQGEIHSMAPRDEPMTTKGEHAPGVKVGNDAAPEFHAQTLPPGSAPSSSTFQPNPISTTPGQANNPNMTSETTISASDTIIGSTSQDVHQGLGMPAQGQSSAELHGDGAVKGTKGKSGLAGVGADQNDSFRERGLDRDFPKGEKEGTKSGSKREDVLGAEERVPEGAESVAAELK